MLKKCLFIITLLLFSSTLFASERESMFVAGNTFVSFGAGAGLSFPPNVFHDATSKDEVVWNVGISLEHFLADKVSFTAELFYETLAMSYRYKHADTILTYDFGYITIPIGIRYVFSNSIFVGAGLYYGVRVRSDHYVTESGHKEHIILLNDQGNTAKERNDIGLFTDIGYNFTLSESSKLSLYLRSKSGVIELAEDHGILARAGTFNAAFSFMF